MASLPVSRFGERQPVVVGDHYANCCCTRRPGTPRDGDAVSHHVVQQMLLRGFSDHGFINRRGPDGAIQRRVPLKSVGAKKHFYSMPGESGGPDRTIENALADVEWLVAPAIERLRFGLPICPGDKQWLAAFIGLLRARTGSMREVIINA